MSDLGWRADGIERARACGGVELERYHRPGFVAGTGVRRSSDTGAGSGIHFEQFDEFPDDPDLGRKCPNTLRVLGQAR